MERLEIICLDTDILIDFLRGDATTIKQINQLEENYELTTTTINLFELYYGAYKGKKVDKNIKSINELMMRFDTLKFTNKAAELSGKILVELEKEGQSIGFRDIMVAGIVLENSIMLYTRNIEHFNKIKGIIIYH